MKLVTDKRKDEEYDTMPALLTNDMSISAEAKILWVKLWNSNKGKKKTYKEWKPTIKSLATQFQVSPRTIKYWISELRTKGWLHTFGAKNCTTMVIHFTPMLVQKTAPVLVQEIAPYTIINSDAEKSTPEFKQDTMSSEENSPASSGIFNEDTSEIDDSCTGDFTSKEIPW